MLYNKSAQRRRRDDNSFMNCKNIMNFCSHLCSSCVYTDISIMIERKVDLLEQELRLFTAIYRQKIFVKYKKGKISRFNEVLKN